MDINLEPIFASIEFPKSSPTYLPQSRLNEMAGELMQHKMVRTSGNPDERGSTHYLSFKFEDQCDLGMRYVSKRSPDSCDRPVVDEPVLSHI